MAKQISIFRSSWKGRNALVIDVVERLAKEQDDTLSNMAVRCILDSPLFKAAYTRMRAEERAAAAPDAGGKASQRRASA